MTQPFVVPHARRLGAIAIAAAFTAFAGSAVAQSRATTPQHPGYVTSASGAPVKNGFGGCVTNAQGQLRSSECPPGTVTAQNTAAPAANASAGRTAAPASARATSGSAASGATTASRLPGYAVASDGQVVRNGFGGCVRSGHWTPANAAEPCDRVATASVPAPAPVAAPAPQPEPAPAPIAVAPPEPPRPVIQKVTLATDVLFDFGKAELKDSGKQKLDELASQVKDANIDEIIAIGHADRIASQDYNQKLSEQRAEAVKGYLSQKVANANRVTAQGKGESSPVTGEDCKKMGPESGSNKKLVSCLQPDRRVEIEVLGTRQVAAGEAPAAAGSTAR